MSGYERTGWRDESISRRHREWGFNCPAVDLDFLMVEYNLGKPVALVEYKHRMAEPPNLRHPTYRALNELATEAGLPFWIARYCEIDWWFAVSPVNESAARIYGKGAVLTEREYVSGLYQLRHQLIEATVISKLKNRKPMVGVA